MGKGGDLTLILPSSPVKAEEAGAEKFAGFLQKLSGKKVKIVKETAGNLPGKKIFFGNTLQGKKIQWCQKEEYIYSSTKDTLLIAGSTPAATLYGAWEYLQKEHGLVYCTDYFIYTPPKASFRWKAGLAVRKFLPFPFRGVYSYFTARTVQRQDFMLFHGMNFFHDEKYRPATMGKAGIGDIYGSPRACHAFYDYVKDWPKEDLELFSLSPAGVRQRPPGPSGPGQVCMTDSRVRKKFLAKLISYIEKDRKGKERSLWPIIYDISPTDSFTTCHCKRCLAVKEKHQAFSGVLVEFINFLADGIRKKYPEIYLQTSAYMMMQDPPQNIRPRKNVIIRIAQLGTEWNGHIKDSCVSFEHPRNQKALAQLAQWCKLGQVGIWDYWILYCGKGLAPYVNTRAVVRNIQTFHKHGVTGLFAECEANVSASFHALKLYMGMRTMTDPGLDMEKEIRRFMEAFYGKSAPFMLQLHNYIEKRNGELKQSIGSLTIAKRRDLDRNFFAVTEELLVKAEKAAGKDARILREIARERISIDYAHLSLYRALYPAGTKAPIAREQLLKRYEASVQSTYRKELLSKGGIIKRKNEVKVHLLRFRANLLPIKNFRGKEVIADFPWTTIESKGGGARIVPDKAAHGGQAMRIKERRKAAILTFGVYDGSKKRHQKTIRLPKEKIPQDGKYHYYSVGKVKLGKSSFLWTHWSWNIQKGLSSLYDTSGLNNDVEIVLSIKVTGPAYIKGSPDKESFYFVDRVLILHPKK